MINTIEIQVKGIGNLDIDTRLSEEFGIPLVFTIDDISNYGKRRSSFSKTIKLPGTRNNNNIFTQLYDIKIDGSFNMTIKHDCALLVNKHPILNGFMVLNSIEKYLVGDKYQIFYEINIFDEVKNLFDQLGERKLTDLDFSSGFTMGEKTWLAGDHILTEDTIQQIYYDEINEYPFTYPLIDYGYSVFNPSGETGSYDNTYPVGFHPITKQFKATSLSLLYPSVFIKAIIDKIFNEIGWTYTSDFFTGNLYDGLFLKLATIYNKKLKITSDYYCCYVNRGGTITEKMYRIPLWTYNWFFSDIYHQSHSLNPFHLFNGPVVQEYENLGNNISGSTYIELSGIKILNTQKYKITFRIEVEDDQNITEETEFWISYYDSEGKSINNTLKVIKSSDYGGPGAYSGETTINAYNLKEGDIVFLTIWPGSSDDGFGNFITYPVEYKGASLELLELPDDDFDDKYNETISLSSYLPDMKQSDFIKNIIKMFNLNLISDKINYNNIIIEPRDDFYINYINWTNKIDFSRKIQIENLNQYNYNNIILKYKESDDYYNSIYKNENNLSNGTKEIKNSNTLYKGDKEIELDFMTYIMKSFMDTDSEPLPLIIPRITEKKDSTLYDDRMETNPAIGIISYIEKDLESRSYFDIILSRLTQVISGITFYNYKLRFDDGNSGVITISHVARIGGKTYDINYESPDSYLLTIDPLIDPNFTDANNLYNTFYKNQIDNLQDKNARLITLYLNLTTSDIINLNFREIITINNQKYILQKIEYDPTKNGSSKVELLKIVSPWKSGIPSEYDLMSIEYDTNSNPIHNDDYYFIEDPDKIRIN